MPDSYDGHAVGLTSPAIRANTVVPNDGTDLSQSTRAIFVGQTGNLRLRTVEGDIVTLANVQGGMIYPIRADRILATGTTAADIVGLS